MTDTEADVFDAAEVAEALERWYADRKRDLPWRDVDDPYRTLVAEVMLQQTRVETVGDYYEEFLEEFPTVEDLAAAEEDDVLEVWAGLGYYRRARHLHEAARRIVDDHGGTLPDDPEALRELPGVGPYTAGAVASIAFDRPEPALDANAKRVVARLVGEDGNVDRAGPKRRIEAATRLVLQGGRPADLTQALMELGSLVCGPRPRCGSCPVAERCRARAEGRQIEIPATDDPVEATPVDVAALAIRHEERVLLVKAPSDGLLPGTWGFPWTEVEEDESPVAAARRHLRELRIEAEVRGLRDGFSYAFSHRKWDGRVVEAAAADAPETEARRWVDVDAIEPDRLPSVHRRILERLDTPLQTSLEAGGSP